MPYRSSRRAGTGHNFFRRHGQSVQRQNRANVLQGTDVTFNLGGDVTGSQEMIGGNIFIPSASITASGSAIITEHQTNNVDGWADVISILDVSESVDYSSDIIGVKNGTTLVLRKPIIVEAVSIGGAAPFTSSLEITKLPVITFRLTYDRAPHFETSQNYLSFAKIGLYDIGTFTGDVSRIKSYMQSSGDPTAFEYKLVEDTQLETTELLIDSGSTSTYDRIGLFLTSSIIDNQWEVSSTNTPNVATLVHDNDFIVAGMAISSSYTTMTASAAGDSYYKVNPVQTISNIRPKTQYRISGDYHAIVDSGSQAKMDVYLHGSAFISASYSGSGADEFGVHLGSFVFPSAGPSEVDDESGMLFSMIPMPFEPDEIGDAQVIYVITNGKWTFADISMQAIQETGFSPGTAEIMIPIRAEVNDRLNFKFEFYDINNNKANYEATSSEMLFEGASTFIGGTNNVLSGSMIIGSTTGSGIEMAGVSSGFIRSIGYEGFISASAGNNQAGFMIWSGSALPAAPDNYSDVGLELNAGPNAGSFRFRTNPSEIDIRADSFFVGTAATQFISGSGGNIEISSSNFHLEPAGDVTMAGTITATAGNIGDWAITGGDIVGSNITMDADSSRIYKTDDNDELTGYYMDFTPGNNYYIRFGTNFAVSSSGVLFASGALIEGVLTSSQGLIADWTIAPGVLSSVAATKYTGMSSTGSTRFFAGADSLDESGSAPFNVKASGELTASDYRFEGSGMITGSVIIGASATILGGLTAETIAVPTSLAPNFLAQITGEGFARFVSASIGGWEVDATTFVGGNVTLSSAGSIKVGGLASATDVGDASTGFFADNSGNILMKGGGANSGYLQANSGDITIKAGTFNLATSTMVLDSATNSGKIALGATPNTGIGGQNKGFYVDGTGDFLLYGSATNYFKFDAAATAIDIKSDTFALTTTSLIMDSAGDSGKGIIRLGASGGPNTPTSGTTGIYMDGGGALNVVGNATNYFRVDGGSFTIKSDTFDLDATTIIMDSYGSGSLALGSTPPTAYNSGNGFFVDGGGKFLIGNTSGNYINFDGSSAFTVKVGSLELAASNIQISSAQASMSLGGVPGAAANILLDGYSSEITIGSNSQKQIVAKGSTTQGYIRTGKTSVSSEEPGFWLANTDGDVEFTVGSGSNDYLKFDAGSFDIKLSQGFELDATNIEISSTQQSASFGEGKIILSGAGTPTLKIGATATSNTLSAGSGVYMDGDGNFRLGDDDGNVKFQNGSFSITGEDVDINVTDINITATGFKLSSTQASMSLGTNDEWKAFGGSTSPYLSVGQATNAYGETGVFLGYVNSVSRPKVSFVGSTGHFKFDQDVDIATGNFELAAANIQVSSNQASMSLGGVPGTAANILLDGANSKIIVGRANKVTIQGGNVDNFIVMGSKTTFGGNTVGAIFGMDSGVPTFDLTKAADNYFRFDTTSGLDLKTTALEVSASNIQLSSTQASASIGNPSSAQGAIVLHSTGTDRFIRFGGKTTFDQTTTAGFIMGLDAGVAEFDFTVGTANDNYFRIDSTGVDLKTGILEVSASNVQISSTHASMSIGDPNSTGGAVVLEVNGTDKMLRFGTKTTFDQDNVDGLIMGINAATNTPEFDFTIGTADNQYIRMTSGGVDIKTPKFILDTTHFDIHSENRRLSVFNTDSTPKEVIRIGEISEAAGDKYGMKVYDGTQTTYSDDGHPNTLVMFGEQGNKVGGWEITNTQIRTIPGEGFGEPFADGETGLILHSSGRMESSDFVTGLKGWRIDTLGNGSAEFENARIRGTLATTVFEKESVNVVGGQLMVSNSTTLQPLRSGSEILAGNASASNTEVTLSMANVSGFVAGEIIKAKRVGQTGFSVEYMQVTGSKRYSTDPALAHITGSQIDPDGLSGEIYVGRGYGTVTNISESVATLDGAISTTATYGTEINIIIDLAAEMTASIQEVLKIGNERFKIISGSTEITGSDQTVTVVRDFHQSDPAAHSDGATIYRINGDNEFLQGLVSTAVEYNEGQVFVSTGKFDADADLSSGYILMNANPNDISTPYMDIIERTGSGVYDLQLRTRLGDLSGLSSAYLYGNEEPGFGLYTENGFFKGTLHAMTGSIHGILHIATVAGGIETDQKISIGRNVSGTNDGIHINNNNYWYTDAEWRVGDATNYIHYDPTTLNIKVEEFELDAGSGDLQISSGEKSMSLSGGDIEFQSIDATQARGRIGSSTSKAIYISGSTTQGYIHQGKLTPDSTAAGFWLGNDAGEIKFSIGAASDAAYIKFNPDGNDGVEVKSDTFYLAANTDDLIIDSENFLISLAASNIVMDGDSNSGAGHIKIGTIANATTTSGVTKGMYVLGGGDFLLKAGAEKYIKFASGDVEVKSGTFYLAANVDDMILDSVNKRISLGAGQILLDGRSSGGLITVGTGNSRLYVSGSAAQSYIRTGKGTFASTTSGFWIGRNGTTTEFHLGDAAEYIKFDGSDLTIKSTHLDISAEDIDMTTTDFSLDADNLQIESSVPSMSLGYDTNVNAGATFVGGSPSYIGFGPKAGFNMELRSTTTDDYLKIGRDFDDALSVAGIILGSDGGTAKIQIVKDANEYLTFDGAAFDLMTTQFNLSTGASGGLTISGQSTVGANNKIMLGAASNITTGAGIFMDGGGAFRAGNPSGDYIKFTGSGNLDIVSSNINITATIFNLNAGVGKLILESTTPSLTLNNASAFLRVGGLTSILTNQTAKGIYFEGDGDFLIKSNAVADENYIKGVGGDLIIKADDIDITSTTFNLTANENDLIIDSVGHSISLADSNIVLDGTDTGYMSIGTVTSATDTAGNNKGFYAAGDGNFITKAAANKYIQFNGGNLDIQTGIFNLNSAKLDINSEAGGSGSIALGPTPPTAYDTGAGFFVDGSGKFLLGDSDADHLSWSGSTLTIKGSIRQTSSGATITDYVDRGTWAVATAYAVNDLVQYVVGANTSTYKCLVAHTSATPAGSDATTGTPNVATTGWAVYVQGTTGASGLNAKTVVVNATSLVFVKSQAGAITPSSVTITGNTQNTTANGVWSNSGGATTVVSSAHASPSVTVSNSQFADAMTITYTLAAGDGSITDTVTLKLLDEGSGTVQAILSNAAHVLPASNAGVVSSYAGSGTTIRVYEGATELLYDTVGTADSSWKVTASTQTNITVGDIADSGDFATVGGVTAHSAVADGTDTSLITYTIEGNTANGTDFSFTQDQTFSKSKAGLIGANAYVVKLTPNQYTVVYGTDGAIIGSDIDFTTAIQGLVGTAHYEFFVDGTTKQGGTTTTTAIYDMADSLRPAIGGEILVKVIFYDNAVEKATDTVTIFAIQDGSDTVNGFLTNASHTVQADSAGTVSSFTTPEAGGTYKVYVGATDVTTSCAFTVSSETGTDVSIVAGTGVYTVNSMSAASGTAIFQAVIPAATAGAAADVTLTADYSISKSVAGTTAKGIQLVLGSSTIAFDNSTGTPSLSPAAAVQDIVCSANLQNISGTPTYSILTSAGAAQTDLLFDGDGGDGVIAAATATIDASTWSSISLGESVQIKVELAGYTDTQSVYALFSGETGDDAVVSLLTNESFTAGAPSTGIATDFTGGTGTMKVFEGVTDDSANWAFSGTATQTGLVCTVTDAEAGGGYVLSGTWTAGTTSETFTITATKSGYSNQTKDFSVAKTVAGATVTGPSGAGVVYRGRWSQNAAGAFAATAYFGATAGSNNAEDRKDVVRYDDGSTDEYYICNSSHTSTNNTVAATGNPSAGPWDEFGASFTSVATDVIFAQDIYADYTVNIGTRNSTPVIALNSDAGNSHANPYIGIGATTYGANNGIFLGYNVSNSSAKTLSLVNSNGSKYFRWTGAALEVDAGNLTIDASGDITATNVDLSGKITADDGAIGDWTIGTALYNTKTTYAVDTGDDGVYIGTDGIAFQDSNINKFTVLGSTGAMHAELGDIAGWNFDSSKLYKEHASENRRLEFDTNATIKDGDGLGNANNHTGQQAISMTSGSEYNAMVQMSNVETFINETDAYTDGEDYVIVEYDDLITSNFTPYSFSYQYHAATLVGEPAAGGGGEGDPPPD